MRMHCDDLPYLNIGNYIVEQTRKQKYNSNNFLELAVKKNRLK